jgi:hypothetical protein
MEQQIAYAGASRHPFRSSILAASAARRKRADDQDIKLFALSFAAFFVCFYTFIF